MKREIKFRMWNFVKDNPTASKMFYDVDEVTACLRQQMLFGSGKTSSGYSHTEDGNAFMQFIGMEDCNGKEIYEGDILEWTAKFTDDIPTPPKRGQVKYNHQGCVWHINYESKGKHYYKEFSATVGSDTYGMETVEVVGNIYESSPDLLIFNE
jgi:uncharacterized phage protein (TIGR01671 family)